ncbi:hypothetical protein BDF22DRAFT_667747 [Syncephalis plumigaleata]|nr:hypothetical protein BDF22DRAFT_667747 [Syncephalis plumigaleata]
MSFAPATTFTFTTNHGFFVNDATHQFDNSVVVLVPKERAIELTGLTLAHAVQYLASDNDNDTDKRDNERPRSVLYLTRDKTKVVAWLQRMLAYADHEQSTDEVEPGSNRLIYPQTFAELIALLANDTLPTAIIIDHLSTWLVPQTSITNDDDMDDGRMKDIEWHRKLESAAKVMSLAVSTIRHLQNNTSTLCQLMITDLLPLLPGRIDTRGSSERTVSLYNVYERWATRIYTLGGMSNLRYSSEQSYSLYEANIPFTRHLTDAIWRGLH